MPDTKEEAALKGVLNDLKGTLSEFQDEKGVLVARAKESADYKEKVVNLTAEVERLTAEVAKKAVPRRGEYGLDDAGVFDKGNLATPHAVHTMKTDDQRILDLQAQGDHMLMMKIIAPTLNDRISLEETKTYQNYQRDMSDFMKALSTGAAGAGAEWLPTDFSSSMIDKVHLEFKAAAMFPQVTMTTKNFTIPAKTANTVGYIITENTSDEGTNVRKSTPTTSSITLQSKTIGGASTFSDDESEDSIIPILPMLRDDLATAMGVAVERAVVNGDATGGTGSHQDTGLGTLESDSAYIAWDGLREAVQSGATARTDISTLNTGLITMRSIMAKYGADPRNLFWLASVSSFVRMGSLDAVHTLDKYGANATINNGELGQYDGIPIIVSEEMRQDLNTAGIYDNSTTTDTILLLCYRPGWMVGNRRQYRVEVDRQVQRLQNTIVGTMRLDFKARYDDTAENIVSLGYSLTS